MRAVVLQMGVSLDGYVAGLGGNLDWGLPPEDEAVTAWKLDSVRRVGTHIMGRVTYEAMAATWPFSTEVYAAPMNDIPKVVFSRTLASADWPDSRIARGNLAEEIDALRHEPGGDIMAHGGASFVQALSRQRLIDEYRLVIRAVALGSGLPLFKDLIAPLPLTLASATTYPDGTAISVYRPTAHEDRV
jgi:dihydrofolate reductase